jgi:hypothetical protein
VRLPAGPRPTGRQAVPTEGGVGRSGGDVILFNAFIFAIGEQEWN